MTDPLDMADENSALRADNARLRRLLDEAGMPDSLRHGLRNTLAMLRTIMRRAAEHSDDVESYVGHLEGRLSALTRVHSVTDAFGEADLHTLVSDELTFHLVREGERATITGPRIRLRPKAAQVMALALHELTSNAVEHGFLALPQGRVDANWHVHPSRDDQGAAEPFLVLVWKEVGGAEVMRPTLTGFGTAVLEEMLTYDLGARATLTYEPDGLRCDIYLPLTTRIGRLVEEATAS